jgi:uncharacterized protein YggU (UPF0235/DUF167 family)
MPAGRLTVRLTPHSGREELVASGDGRYAGRVTAPPVDGRANDALCRLVARAAGVAPSRVRVVRGRRGREKVVEVDGLDAAALRERIGTGFPPRR